MIEVDPSQMVNPIALAFSVPAHLMTYWRLMSRTLQGQWRYLRCPNTMTVKSHLWSIFFSFSRFPLLKDGMGNGEWVLILKYQFPRRSRITYRLSVSSVILPRLDWLQTHASNRPCCLLKFSFEFHYGVTELLLLVYQKHFPLCRLIKNICYWPDYTNSLMKSWEFAVRPVSQITKFTNI